MAKKKPVSDDVNRWLGQITAYEKEFKTWESRAENILKRYRDEHRTKSETGQAKFNILWSNVQTLTAATFSKLPKPDVSRRFKDQDPVGRVAALILERALEYEVQKYTDYTATLKSSIWDRFLGGRGTSWVRYEPHFKAIEQKLPTDGLQVSEDVQKPTEQLDYECVPCDYVHWRDFGHTPARTWEEVNAVWRQVFLTRQQCVDRFGEEIGSKIPLDSRPDDSKDKLSTDDEEKSRARVFEIWDKPSKTAIWLSKSLKEILDEKEDPLGLEEFFPCPKPLFATLTNDSLVPIPDFALYQDQANSLDIICERIDGLIKALKVNGCYDSSIPELKRLFTEGSNNTLIPVKNWAAFAEKNGLQGAINIVDLAPIAMALREAYTAMEQVKAQVYEITGISDIVRGQTDARETLGAQELKGQYASLRLKSYQDEVARYATELLQIKAQIICGKFNPQTILTISAADQLSDTDKQVIPQAIELLIGQERTLNPDAPQGPNPLRSFRIEVAADTLVYLDEQAEKQSRMEFITAIGGFMNQSAQIAMQAPQMVPLLMEFIKFGATAFKVGKTIEGKIDEAVQQVMQAASQPKPPDPAQEAERMKAESEARKLQGDMKIQEGDMVLHDKKMQIETIKAGSEQVKAQAGVIQSNLALEKAKFDAQHPNGTGQSGNR